MFELKPAVAAQPRDGKLESKINISPFQFPFRQYGAFYKNITKSDETNRTCNKYTAVFCMQIFVNAPSTHMCVPHSSMGLHSGSFTNHPAMSTSDDDVIS